MRGLLSLCVNSRRFHSWVWWLLPLLVARALVPVGFMAQAADQGGLQIVICQVGAPKFLTQNAGDTQHSGQTQDDSSSNNAHWQHDHACPFGHAVAAPIAQFSGGESIAFFASSEARAATEPPYFAAGPPRRITNRGPPAHV